MKYFDHSLDTIHYYHYTSVPVVLTFIWLWPGHLLLISSQRTVSVPWSIRIFSFCTHSDTQCEPWLWCWSVWLGVVWMAWHYSCCCNNMRILTGCIAIQRKMRNWQLHILRERREKTGKCMEDNVQVSIKSAGYVITLLWVSLREDTRIKRYAANTTQVSLVSARCENEEIYAANATQVSLVRDMLLTQHK